MIPPALRFFFASGRGALFALIARNPFRIAVVLLFVLLTSTPAYSQETPDPDNPGEVVESEVVVTAQTVNESLDDPPVFVQVIEMKDYRGRFVTVTDALRQAAGVTTRDFGGLGKASTISIRGSTAEQVVVLVDGVRLNPSTGGGVDLSGISANQIERIEIVRGGDSAFYGEGAVGGVVNIVTKKAGAPKSSSVGASYGSFNTLDAKASHAQRFETGGFLASATYLHSGGRFPYDSDNGTTLDESDDRTRLRKNNAVDDRNLLVKGDWAVSNHLVFSAQNDLHSAIKGVPGLVTFPSEKAWQADLRNVAQVNATLADLPVSGLNFRTALSYRYNQLTFADRLGEQTGVPVQNGYTENEPRVRETIQYIWGAHQIWTLQGEWAKILLRETDNTFGHPERDVWAAALRDQVILWGDRISLVPAVRYDDASDAGSQWSPKFGLHFRPWHWLVLKGNAGRSFRAPNFSELYFNQGFVVGNPDLKPERATSFDAGLQIVTRPVFFEAAWFRSDVEDLIEYTLISGFRYKPLNIGQARTEGAELIATVNPVRYLTASGAYTLTYAIDTTDQENRSGNQIPGRPRNQAFGRIEAGPDFLRAFAEYSYIGPNFITQANTKLLDARKILNTGIVVHPDEQTAFGVEMKNVLDDRAVDVRGFPLPGRSVFVSFEKSF